MTLLMDARMACIKTHDSQPVLFEDVPNSSFALLDGPLRKLVSLISLRGDSRPKLPACHQASFFSSSAFCRFSFSMIFSNGSLEDL